MASISLSALHSRRPRWGYHMLATNPLSQELRVCSVFWLTSRFNVIASICLSGMFCLCLLPNRSKREEEKKRPWEYIAMFPFPYPGRFALTAVWEGASWLFAILNQPALIWIFYNASSFVCSTSSSYSRIGSPEGSQLASFGASNFHGSSAAATFLLPVLATPPWSLSWECRWP